MSFIGSKPSQTLATPTSQYFNGTGSQTVFTLNRAVNVAEDLEVFVNNIQQEPGVGKSYTAVGTTLTFDAAPSSGTANVYVVYRGLAEVTTRLEHDPNAALAATTGTFSGTVTADGLTVDGKTVVGSSSSNALEIHSNGDTEIAFSYATKGNIYGKIIGDITQASPLGGEIAFQTATGGSLTEVVRVQTGGLTFTPATSNLYTVSGTLSYYGTTNNVYLNGASSGGMIMSGNGNRNQYVYLNSVSDSVKITTNTLERLGIDSSGRVTMPYQPMVSATRTTNFGTLGGNTLLIPYNSATVNVGNHYNTSTGLFTCPVSGKYRVTAYGMNVSASGDGAFYYNALLVEVAGSTQQGTPYNYGDGYVHMSGSWIVSASANDSIGIRTSSCLGGYGGVTIELIG